MKAAEDNQVGIVKLLLLYRADINAANKKGRTALSFAVSPSMGRKVAVGTLKLLLDEGADPTYRDSFGLDAKGRARKEKRTEALDILREYEESMSR